MANRSQRIHRLVQIEKMKENQRLLDWKKAQADRQKSEFYYEKLIEYQQGYYARKDLFLGYAWNWENLQIFLFSLEKAIGKQKEKIEMFRKQEAWIYSLYMEQRKKKEIMDKLRDRWLVKEHLDQARKDQKISDDRAFRGQDD